MGPAELTPGSNCQLFQRKKKEPWKDLLLAFSTGDGHK
jgi:hypothetical protein